MKSRPIFRLIFAFLVVAGSLFILHGARQISLSNSVKQTNICDTDPGQPLEQSNTEFIFFESVTKYLVVSLIR